MEFINIADLVDSDDSQGRTYRQINKSKKHKFKIGQLVELENGVRLFIAKQTRDCDGTVLYSLCSDRDDIEQQNDGSANYKWLHGYGENNMKAVSKNKLG